MGLDQEGNSAPGGNRPSRHCGKCGFRGPPRSGSPGSVLHASGCVYEGNFKKLFREIMDDLDMIDKTTQVIQAVANKHKQVVATTTEGH